MLQAEGNWRGTDFRACVAGIRLTLCQIASHGSIYKSNPKAFLMEWKTFCCRPVHTEEGRVHVCYNITSKV